MPPAYEILLLNTAVPQIQAAQSGDTYVVPRDIAFSAALTLSAGTANGVPYLNGSKVLTSGSALTFDGVTFTSSASSPVAQTVAKFENQNAASRAYVSNFTGSMHSRWSTYGDGGIVGFGTISNHPLAFEINAAEQMRLTSKALMVGYTNDSGFSGQYNAAFSGNVGIGTSSPSTSLHIVKDIGGGISGPTAVISLGGNSSYRAAVAGYQFNYADRMGLGLYYYGASGQQLGALLDSSGNLGLGVTPSAWTSGFKTLQIGSVASFLQTAAGETVVAYNYYSEGGVNKYITNNHSVLYLQSPFGSHQWFTAPSGTANDPISFGGAKMTLDVSGNLVVGDTAATTGAKIDALGRVMSSNSDNDRIVITQAGRSVAPTLLDGGTALFGLGNGAAGITVVGDGVSVPLGIGTYGNEAFILGTNNTERARITSGGDFQTSSGNSVMVGGTAARATTAGTNRVDIFDGTAPVGTLANGVSFYSASGEANVMDAAGNATLLSPHDAVTNEWIFRSKHTPTGKVLKIDVERLLKFVNDHFGLDAVHEFIED